MKMGLRQDPKPVEQNGGSWYIEKGIQLLDH